MFGIPGEIFWPTAAIGSLIVLVLAGVVVLRLLPRPRSAPRDREQLEDLQARLGDLERLEARVGELEERLDFAERLVAKQREGERLQLPRE